MVLFIQENAHFGGPEEPGGGPKTTQKKKYIGARSRLPAAKKNITEKMASRWTLKQDENEDKGETDEKLIKNWDPKKACLLTAEKWA